MTDRRVLVTGAGGFIGSHLAESLTRVGWRVRAMVHYNARLSKGWLDESDPHIADAIEVLPGDIRDRDFVQGAVRGCDAVLHLAALIGIPYSYLAPAQYVDTNIVGTLNVLQAARDLGTQLVVQTSTSEVYGSAQTVPMPEEHPLVGQSPYAATKIASDQLALSFFRTFGTPVIVVRPFNTYGPRQSARAVIPTIISQLLSGRGEVRLGSLSPTRDFNFVGDTVRGFQAALETPGAVGEVINVGSGFELSIGDVLAIIGEVVGVPTTAVSDAHRVRPEASEVDRLFADNAKALRVLGWSPEYGGREGFRRGIERTVAWFRARGSSAATSAHYAT